MPITNLRIALAASVVFACSLGGAAQARDDGDSAPGDWYLAAAGTVSLLNDANQLVANAPTPTGTVVAIHRQETGYGFQAEVGRRIGHARIGLEAGYAANHSSGYTAIIPANGNIPSDGHQNAFRIMANGYFDFGKGPVQPYIGAGAGYTRVLIKVTAAPANVPTAPAQALLDDHASRFAYQLMAGTAVRLNRRLSLTAQYRWFDAGDLHFHDLGANRPVTRSHAGHNIDIGVRVGF